MPYCPQCGTKIEVQWNVCPNCGCNVKQEIDLINENSQKMYQSYPEPIGSDQQQTNYPPLRTFSASQNNTNGIVALVFGILGLCCIYGSMFNLIFGVIAIIFGAIGIKKDDKPQMAKVGLALGIIVLVCGIFIFAMMIPFMFYFLSPY
jgi:uncharacterized membrane protein YvbJ